MERRDTTLEGSYQSWKSRRPQLFPQHSSPAEMVCIPVPVSNQHSSADMLKATNTITHIAAIADGQEKTVQLPRTRYDAGLNRSIISKERARATKGVIKNTPEMSLVDSTGQSYTSRTSVNLRWHAKDSAQSFSETFYVVESCGSYDAMLRKDIQKTDTTPHAYPFRYEKETKSDRDRRLAQEQARSKELQQRQVDTARRVRDNYIREREKLQKSKR